MRYIDTGSRNGVRDSTDAVGSWLRGVLANNDVAALRIQSGYVSPEPFGYLEPVLDRLATTDGETSILVGSNGGETAQATAEDLLRLAGPPRPHLQLGIASFADGLFHPKVYHVVRDDSSMAAYVGSANLTYAGISGKNVEAGITLDTRDGDDLHVLSQIADAIDAWFLGPQIGVFPIQDSADVSRLVVDGVLGAARPKRIANPKVLSGSGGAMLLTALGGLLRLPAISKRMAIPPTPRATRSPTGVVTRPPTPTFVAWWSKKLPASDAQRKPTGSQSGVIALTRANHTHIDQTTYFRNVLFGGLLWQKERTRTGRVMDVAQAPMHTTLLGTYLGVLTFEINHDIGREAGQGNYTTKLSLAPVRKDFAQTNMTGTIVEIGRDTAGDYWLDFS